ncbi:MAG: FIST C-terminal domain-containing protein [Deltaproteobacteria bacterium]|nr:FIST C-terminal domain-containing protein [Deltaproteobacteria bacterium]
MKKNYNITAEVTTKDEKKAVAEMADKINQAEMAGVIFFCSSEYDLDKLAEEIDATFSCPVIGCTTAGEIGAHYQTNSIVGVSFSSAMFCFHTKTMERLHTCDAECVKKFISRMKSKLKFSETIDPEKMFGFLLIDGLSGLEESVISDLYGTLEGVSIIGGSAGDNLKFEETKVYANGKFISNAAVFTLIETRLPFKTFKLQHFVPSEIEMVVTETNPSKRIVYEIDGGPAAEEYAKLVGVDVTKLDAAIFAMYPVMLQLGDEWYVRSIQKVNEDGSLTFYCAIENGLVLTIGKGVGLVDTLKEQINKFEAEFEQITFTLGCDCILRRLEIFEKGEKEKMERELNKINFLGFSTFGEQYNAIHINQTLTGVVFGGETK